MKLILMQRRQTVDLPLFGGPEPKASGSEIHQPSAAESLRCDSSEPAPLRHFSEVLPAKFKMAVALTRSPPSQMGTERLWVCLHLRSGCIIGQDAWRVVMLSQSEIRLLLTFEWCVFRW